MTSEDLSARLVRKALTAVSGDAARAERMLLDWCDGDVRLLAGLARPYLPSIVAHAVQRQRAERPARSGRRGLSEQGFDAMVGALERRIGTAADPVGMTALLKPPTPSKAGARHERALRQVAAAFIEKRIDAAESRSGAGRRVPPRPGAAPDRGR